MSTVGFLPPNLGRSVQTTTTATPPLQFVDRVACVFCGSVAVAHTLAGRHPLDPVLAPHNDGDYHSGRLWSLAGFAVVPAWGMQVIALLGFCGIFYQVAQLTTDEDEIDSIDSSLAAVAIVNPLAFLFWFFQPEYSDVWSKKAFGLSGGWGSEAETWSKPRRCILANLCFVAIPNIFIAASWVDGSPYLYGDGAAMGPAHIAVIVSSLYVAATTLILM